MVKKKGKKRRARARARGRGSRAQPVAVIGQSIQAVTPTQMEALDKLRMTPDIVKDLEKKKQDDRFKDLTDSNTLIAFAQLESGTASSSRVVTPQEGTLFDNLLKKWPEVVQ